MHNKVLHHDDGGVRQYEVFTLTDATVEQFDKFIAGLITQAETIFAPLRVAWLPKERNGLRAIRARDLILGDPRSPNSLRQRYIAWRFPERYRLLAAEADTAGRLLERYEASVQNQQGPRQLGAFVRRAAILSLERSERRLRGTRYKVPRMVQAEVLDSAAFRTQAAQLMEKENVDPQDLISRAEVYLKEMAAEHHTLLLDLLAQFARFMYSRGYDEDLDTLTDEIARVKSLTQTHPVVFLFTHKSHLDGFVLTRTLFDNDFPPTHTFGGINMNFPGLGTLIKRTGVIFIRRSFQDNEIYKLVFRSFVRYLVEKGFPLMWSIEGGRSRTGKLLSPRFGLLSYVVEAYRSADVEDMVLVPVSIAYDQIPEVADYVHEQRGGTKQAESLGWFMRYITGLRDPFGRIFVRFGEPLHLSNLDSLPDTPGSPAHIDDHQLDVQKLAFEVSERINRVTPVTATALVALTLLGAGRQALTLSELYNEVSGVAELVRRRGLPVTGDLHLDPRQALPLHSTPWLAPG